MGWLISIVMLIMASRHGNDILMITSGLFAIAGAIAEVGAAVKKIQVNVQQKTDSSDLSFLD